MNLIDNSMVISTGAYVLGKIVREGISEDDFKDLVEFEDNSVTLIVNALKDSFDKTNQQKKFNLDRVNYIAKFIIDELGIDSKFLLSNPEICVRKTTYRKLKASDNKNNFYQKEVNGTPEKQIKQELDLAPTPALEMFNSFFLKPLDLVRNNINKFTPYSPISKYLGVEDKPHFKDVLKEPQLLKELLELSKMQVARWPSSPRNCLAALQTAAINNIIQKTENNEHIFAIKGPPGTGKTTLLFDIIANIYVKRAFNFTKFKTPDKGFSNDKYSFKIMGLEYEVAAIDSSLHNYEIVVASSNNSAVENISKELPLYVKIDKIYHEEIKFFDWLANNEEDNKNWGIFTAVLGRSANRQAFMDKFWKPEFASFKTNESYKFQTMFQYLNLLKGKPEAHTLKHLMPDYCNSPTLIKETWQKECKYFNQLHQEILDINKAIEEIITLNKQKSDLLEIYQNKDLLKVLEEWTEQIKSLESNLQYIDSKIQELNYERKLLSLGFFTIIHTFLKTKKYENFIQDNLRLTHSKSEQLDLAQKTKADIQLLKDKSKKLKLDIEQLVQIEQFLSDHAEFLEAKKFDVASFKEDGFWQNHSNNYDEFHKTTPYFNQEVEKLRSKLFIQAIKLHEIFINANANNFWNSLHFFSEIISGKLNNITRVSY